MVSYLADGINIVEANVHRIIIIVGKDRDGSMCACVCVCVCVLGERVG